MRGVFPLDIPLESCLCGFWSAYIRMCVLWKKLFNRSDGTAHFDPACYQCALGARSRKSSVTFQNCQRCLSCAHVRRLIKTADGTQERFLCKQLFALLLPPVVTAPLINIYAFISKDSCTSTDHSFNKYTAGVWCVCMCFGRQVMLPCVLWACICRKTLKVLFSPVLAGVETDRSAWFSAECETWCLEKSFWLLAQIKWSPCLRFTMLVRQKTHSRNAIVPSVPAFINTAKHRLEKQI